MGGSRVLEKRGVLLLVHPAATVQIRNHDAWIHGVDAYAFGGDFKRRAARELIDG